MLNIEENILKIEVKSVYLNLLKQQTMDDSKPTRATKANILIY